MARSQYTHDFRFLAASIAHGSETQYVKANTHIHTRALTQNCTPMRLIQHIYTKNTTIKCPGYIWPKSYRQTHVYYNTCTVYMSNTHPLARHSGKEKPGQNIGIQKSSLYQLSTHFLFIFLFFFICYLLFYLFIYSFCQLWIGYLYQMLRYDACVCERALGVLQLKTVPK